LKKNPLYKSLILIFFTTTLLGFQCNKRQDFLCNNRETKTSIGDIGTNNNSTNFLLGDSVFFSFQISDTLTDTTTGKKDVADLTNLKLYLETFKIIFPANSTIPNIQPVYSNFNPLIIDGQYLNDPFGRLYEFRCRRLNNTNFLLAGLECMQKGLYLIRLSFQQGTINGSGLYYVAANQPCAQFILNPVYKGNQNNSIFSTYNTSTLPIATGYSGFTSVSKTDKNYLIIDVK
jgi:hypothetical protein